jgi:hypothetical protein
VKQPVRNRRRMFQLHEEPREYQKWADEERPEDCAELYVEDGRHENAETLRHKTHQQVDGEESGEAEELEWLTS